MEINLNKEKVNKLIDQFLSVIQDKDPIKLLKKIYIYKFLVAYDKNDDLNHLNLTILTNMITYLISIYQSVSLDIKKYKETTFDTLEDLIELFNDIYIYSSNDSEFSLDSKVTSLKDVSSGISYPMITIDLIISLLFTQEEFIKEKVKG